MANKHKGNGFTKASQGEAKAAARHLEEKNVREDRAAERRQREANRAREQSALKQALDTRIASASMSHTDMLAGVKGEYLVPIMWNKQDAGWLLITTEEHLDNKQLPVYLLKVVMSTFAGIRADEHMLLPVWVLKFQEVHQGNKSDKLFDWQCELHAALRGMIWNAIELHFNFKKPVQKNIPAKKFVPGVKAVVIQPTPVKVAAPLKQVKVLPTFSKNLLYKDGKYYHQSGVTIETFTKGGVKKIAIKFVPNGYKPLVGMTGYYVFASSVTNFDDQVRDKFVNWLRSELDIHAEETAAA